MLNADQLGSFTINFLTFGAIHGGVLPFLNRIFGARFVPCEAIPFKEHRFTLRCKQSSALFLFRLRMTLTRIK